MAKVLAESPQAQLHILCCWIWIETVGLDFLEPQTFVKPYCSLHASQGVKPHFFISQIFCSFDKSSTQAAPYTLALELVIDK